MIKKSLLAIAVVAAFAVNAQAAIRTIDIEYVGGTSSGWIVGELAPNTTINDANGLGLDVYHQENDVNMSGNPTTFSSTGLSPTFHAGIDFQNSIGEDIRMVFPGTGPANLASLADGVYTATVVNLYGAGNTQDLSVTIGTAAIPEPSAFAFGGLALGLVGIRRWGRNWFKKAA